jgi:CDP-diacylglycerol--glycerol-3-phosphate 3-phosphatidyltransferase
MMYFFNALAKYTYLYRQSAKVNVLYLAQMKNTVGNFKNKVPASLIILRLLLGPVLVVFSIFKIDHYTVIAVAFLVTGLLSDIFDGIIARRLGISSEKFRRMDSNADQFFFITTVGATIIQCPQFFWDQRVWLILLMASEAMIYAVSYIRFRKEVATHSIGAKIWSLTLVAALVEIMLTCNSAWLFQVCFWIGIVSRMEITAILLLKTWTSDVPTLFHAWQIRNGKTIKRHKLFNG